MLLTTLPDLLLHWRAQHEPLKEVYTFIIRGRNLHPQDIEQVVQECHAQLHPRCGAAFAVEGRDLGLEESSGEQLVVVQDVGRHYAHISLLLGLAA
jgi:hypothetical protein